MLYAQDHIPNYQQHWSPLIPREMLYSILHWDTRYLDTEKKTYIPMEIPSFFYLCLMTGGWESHDWGKADTVPVCTMNSLIWVYILFFIFITILVIFFIKESCGSLPMIFWCTIPGKPWDSITQKSLQELEFYRLSLFVMWQWQRWF